MSVRVLFDEIRQGLCSAICDMDADSVKDDSATGNNDRHDKKLLDMINFDVSLAKPGFGDASSNVAFLLARVLKKSPADISKVISDMYNGNLSAGSLVSACVSHPSGFVNFKADWKKLARLILLNSRSDTFGDLDLGKNTTVTVEHTSVNPNKALHIGHVRNVIVGDTVSRILRKSGHTVKVLNYVDDSGLQVADVIVGFRHLGFSQDPPAGKTFAQYCGDDVYVKTTEKYESDPKLESVRRDTLKEIEDSTTETAALADKITRRVLADQLETCWRLSVRYNCLNFESHIIRSGLWSSVFGKLKEMKLLELDSGGGKNDGCWVIRGANASSSYTDSKKDGSKDDGGHTNVNNEESARQASRDKVVVRSNGTATYIAKDIPYAAWKLGLLEDPFHYVQYPNKQPGPVTLWQTTLDCNATDSSGALNFSGDRVITVIDSRQSGLQKIITNLMRRFKSSDTAYVHLAYESVTLSPDTAKSLGVKTGGKAAQMSGRRGLYVDADSVYDTLYKKSVAETLKRHPEMADDHRGVSDIANAISVGTIRYEMLKQDLDKIITFDLAKSLSLEGDTASYVQYAGARASRILERAARAPAFDMVNFEMFQEQAELDLIKIIGSFEVAVHDAVKNLSPKVVARYCHDLAVSFNTFYESCRVLGLENSDIADARLYLVYSFRLAVTRALNLIGIDAPDVM